MINPPRTKAQAEAYRYSVWAGNPKGLEYRPERCAYEAQLFYQCTRRPGHGPEALYCKQHAKKAKA